MSKTTQRTTRAAKSEEKLTEKAGTLARNVYLANLGLYGKLYEQGQDLYKQTEQKYRQTGEKARELYGKREKIFNDLVKRGEEVQSQAKETFEKVTTEQRKALDERFEKLKETVGVRTRETTGTSRTSQSRTGQSTQAKAQA